MQRVFIIWYEVY